MTLSSFFSLALCLWTSHVVEATGSVPVGASGTTQQNAKGGKGDPLAILKSTWMGKPLAGRRNLQSINCNSESVSEWIDEEVVRKECGEHKHEYLPYCEMYQHIEHCHELSNDYTPDSLGLGQSEYETCQYFRQDPYFMDSDSLNPYAVEGEFPTAHKCYESDYATCEVLVSYFEEEDVSWGQTAAPTMAPFTKRVPCTRCDFFYDNDEVCFDADCSTFNCMDKEGGDPVVAATSSNTIAVQAVEKAFEQPESVRVCFNTQRTDLFSYSEYRQIKGWNEYYGCVMQTEQRIIKTEFHVGATNVHHMEFTLGDIKGPGDQQVGPGWDEDEEDLTLDYCEVKLDGEACSSCRICGEEEFGNLAVDCSNLVEGATTSCDDAWDGFVGVLPKILVLQDGYNRAPTTAPTSRPSPSPTPHPSPNPTPRPSLSPTPRPTRIFLSGKLTSSVAVKSTFGSVVAMMALAVIGW